MIAILSLGLYDMNAGSNVRLHLDIFELTHNATNLDEKSQEKFNSMRTESYESLQLGVIAFLIGMSGIVVSVIVYSRRYNKSKR